jgi:hypothetical protein
MNFLFNDERIKTLFDYVIVPNYNDHLFDF